MTTAKPIATTPSTRYTITRVRVRIATAVSFSGLMTPKDVTPVPQGG